MVTGNLGDQIFIVLSWLLALAWLRHAIVVSYGVSTLPDLTRSGDSAPSPFAEDEDEITVIVPACNEEDSIEATLRSLLSSTGVRLEVIAVDDRSTDETGARMDQIAAEAAAASRRNSLHVIHVTELPTGWLGKPHAMAVAARQAKAPWLLFTDGDIVFHPQALEIALHDAEARDADHLVLVPTVTLKTTGEAAMLATMNVLSQWMIRLWKVADPRAKDFIGVGGFNLIRREVYEKLGGFDALRMEVLDDLRLGWLVKRAGYRQRVVLGRGLVRLRWLQGALGVAHLAEKNGFAAYRYRTEFALLAGLGLAVQAVWPLAAIACGGGAMAAGLVTYCAIFLTYRANRKVTNTPPWLAVFFAPATLVVLYALMCSMILTLARKGVDWRGTRYPLKELRRYAGRGW